MTASTESESTHHRPGEEVPKFTNPKEQIVFKLTSKAEPAEGSAADALIPFIRAAATIGFAIAPCSLGFVIIAVSEHLIRSIMVGDDPEMLVSDVQNQFPSAAMEIIENDDAGLVADVVDLIDRPDPGSQLRLDIHGGGFQMRVWDALQKVTAGATVNFTFLAEQIGAPKAARAAVPGC